MDFSVYSIRGIINGVGEQGEEPLFEWDSRKAQVNERKHGVSFVEAISVFVDPLAATAADMLHSRSEDRFRTIGHSNKGRLLMVIHTERQGRRRIITARKATPQERREHARESKNRR